MPQLLSPPSPHTPQGRDDQMAVPAHLSVLVDDPPVAPGLAKMEQVFGVLQIFNPGVAWHCRCPMVWCSNLK